MAKTPETGSQQS